MNRSSMPKQVMAFSNGGLASFIPRQTEIYGQPHELAYIRPEEGELLRRFGGMGTPGPGGVPQYGLWESVTGKPFAETKLGQALGLGDSGDDDNKSNIGSSGYVSLDAIAKEASPSYSHPTDNDDKPSSSQPVAPEPAPGEEEEPLPGSGGVLSNFNFFGGYVPTTRADVLVTNPDLTRPGEFMPYDGVPPGMNEKFGETQVMPKMPAVDPMVQKRLDHMQGIAALLGQQPATEAMYQGIMS
ncbi:MAG: hypothetical protein ACPHEP_01885 [Acidimicrobiales bacterium]